MTTPTPPTRRPECAILLSRAAYVYECIWRNMIYINWNRAVHTTRAHIFSVELRIVCCVRFRFACACMCVRISVVYCPSYSIDSTYIVFFFLLCAVLSFVWLSSKSIDVCGSMLLVQNNMHSIRFESVVAVDAACMALFHCLNFIQGIPSNAQHRKSINT